jgi:hypothetical protein
MLRWSMRARLVNLSSRVKITSRRSSMSASSQPSVASSSKRSESARTRSTTRPSRVEVDRMSAPHAEIKTAGVIMAVRTARAEESGSMSVVVESLLRYL